MRRIAHLSDLHFGRHDPVVAEDLLSDLAALAPDLVIVSGDLTQRARRHEFAAARDYLARIGRPTFSVPGNHDLPLYNPLRRFIDPRKRYCRYIAADREPFFVDAELAVLGLDTTRSSSWKDGRVSQEQAARVAEAFSHAADRLRILVTHHPLIAARDAPAQEIVGRSGLALAAIDSTRIDLLLSGHHHRSASDDSPIFRGGPGRSILVMHAGTAISTRQRDENNSYNLIDIDGGQVSCTVRVWRHGAFAAGLDRRYRRKGGGGWQRDPDADPEGRLGKFTGGGATPG